LIIVYPSSIPLSEFSQFPMSISILDVRCFALERMQNNHPSAIGHTTDARTVPYVNPIGPGLITGVGLMSFGCEPRHTLWSGSPASWTAFAGKSRRALQRAPEKLHWLHGIMILIWI